MKQPIKKVEGYKRKKTKFRMRQSNGKTLRTHPKFGTSKLEKYFETEFLKKLNINYQWQFEAKDIQRSYDFYLPEHNLLIEVDGDYYHVNPEIYEGKKLTPTQKHDMWVDKLKNEWALLHGIPLLRIWENDIRKNPEKVMKTIKERLRLQNAKIRLEENKNKRHINKIQSTTHRLNTCGLEKAQVD
jgi:hypothetical protein|nr:MAG TPA: restriction enzyme [Caudoviricetes sp.]